MLKYQIQKNHQELGEPCNIIVRTFFGTKKKIEVMKEQLKSDAIIKIKEQLHFCAQKM